MGDFYCYGWRDKSVSSLPGCTIKACFVLSAFQYSPYCVTHVRESHWRKVNFLMQSVQIGKRKWLVKTKCPKFVDTCWLSMGRMLGWLAKHQIDVQQHMEAKYPSCKPDKSWWVIVYILLDFTDMMNIAFWSLQGLTLLVSTQEFLRKELADN